MAEHYEMEVNMDFRREVGAVVSEGGITIHGENGEQIDTVLKAVLGFLHQMGFNFVEELHAVNESGIVGSST